MEQNREEKREGREIRFGAPQKRPEREHGKLYRWFDNFWYHHKWATIAALVIILVLSVCIFQMCSREEEGDVTLITAGPYGFTANEAGLNDLKKCLATYVAGDYNGNGIKDVTLHSYTIFSEAEAAEYEGRVDENGESLGLRVDRYQNTQAYQSFTQYLTTGDAAVMFVSPWLAQEYATTTNALVNLNELLGTTPENGVAIARAGGESVCYGVRLSETALWRENSAIRDNLPEDTVICLLAPGILGNNADVEIYNRAVSLFVALIQ